MSAPTDEDKTYQSGHFMQVFNKKYTYNLCLIRHYFVSLLLSVVFILVSVSDALSLEQPNSKLNVAIASNFLFPLKSLLADYKRLTNTDVRLSAGSTSKLYAQIINGAPFDVFLSADKQAPQRLVNDGYGEVNGFFAYARGQLVLWSMNDKFPSSNALENALVTAKLGRLAMANPKIAPYGRAAKQVLQYLNVRLRPKQMIIGESVGQSFQFTESKNVDMGFVAYSQINATGHKGVVWLVPSEYYQPIDQFGLILSRTKNLDASKQFVEYLTSRNTQQKLEEEFGYLPKEN